MLITVQGAILKEMNGRFESNASLVQYNTHLEGLKTNLFVISVLSTDTINLASFKNGNGNEHSDHSEN